MNTKPKSIIYLSVSLLLTAVSFPVQIMVLYNHSPSEVGAIVAKISDLNLVVILSCLFSALLVYRVAAAAKIFTPVLLALVGINNGVVSSVADDYSQIATYLATLAFFLIHLPLLNPEIKMLLHNPRSRWWLTPRRKRLEIPMMLSPFKEQTIFRSKTFDLSEGGAFIPFSETLNPLTEMKINDSMFLCLNLGTLTQLRCQAKVVRISDSKGDYPAGIGLSFSDLGFSERRKLIKYVNSRQGFTSTPAELPISI